MPDIGDVHTYSDNVYELFRKRDWIRPDDGVVVPMLDWRSECAECGEEYTVHCAETTDLPNWRPAMRCPDCAARGGKVCRKGTTKEYHGQKFTCLGPAPKNVEMKGWTLRLFQWESVCAHPECSRLFVIRRPASFKGGIPVRRCPEHNIQGVPVPRRGVTTADDASVDRVLRRPGCAALLDLIERAPAGRALTVKDLEDRLRGENFIVPYGAAVQKALGLLLSKPEWVRQHIRKHMVMLEGAGLVARAELPDYRGPELYRPHAWMRAPEGWPRQHAAVLKRRPRARPATTRPAGRLPPERCRVPSP